MTVAELIELLKQRDPAALVVTTTLDGNDSALVADITPGYWIPRQHAFYTLAELEATRDDIWAAAEGELAVRFDP